MLRLPAALQDVLRLIGSTVGFVGRLIADNKGRFLPSGDSSRRGGGAIGPGLPAGSNRKPLPGTQTGAD